MPRDDFTKKTKKDLAMRVGYRCSNPDCRVATIFPSEGDSRKVSIIGQAAHITAASPGGPRYDSNMTSEDRRSIGNGIWLCNNCARLIDRDELEYTVTQLREWKVAAEEKQRIETKIYKPIVNDSRRLEIEKDFRNIHTYIFDTDMRNPSMDFFCTVDSLIDKYMSDSFFAYSSLLEILDELASILADNTVPNGPPIPHDEPLVEKVLELRKEFTKEYKRLFFYTL